MAEIKFIKRQREIVLQLLKNHNFAYRGDPNLEWSYEDKVFLWSIPTESKHSHKAFVDTPALWMLTGDCPSDFLFLQPVGNKVEAITLFAQRFGYAARSLREGCTPDIILGDNINATMNKKKLMERLETYSALLFSLIDDGRVPLDTPPRD